MRALAVLVCLLCLGACSAQADGESGLANLARTAEAASDSSMGAERENVPVTVRPDFDPGALQRGDTVLGLTVVTADVELVLADSVWVGDIVLEGDLVVHGLYQRHPDWPIVEAPCVHVVRSASIARIPRFPPDRNFVADPRTWFCLENAALALAVLGMPQAAYEVVVALDRYVARRDLADTFDTARLAEFIEVGPVTAATLSAP